MKRGLGSNRARTVYSTVMKKGLSRDGAKVACSYRTGERMRQWTEIGERERQRTEKESENQTWDRERREKETTV